MWWEVVWRHVIVVVDVMVDVVVVVVREVVPVLASPLWVVEGLQGVVVWLREWSIVVVIVEVVQWSGLPFASVVVRVVERLALVVVVVYG